MQQATFSNVPSIPSGYLPTVSAYRYVRDLTQTLQICTVECPVPNSNSPAHIFGSYANMWIVFLFVAPIACLQAASPKLLIPDFGQPVKTVNIGNEKWCLVRCVEFNSSEDQRDTLEAFYKPDTFQTNVGCGAIGCDQLLAEFPKPTPRCRSGNPEVVCQSEVVYRPVSSSSTTTKVPTRRARVRAEIVYHPRKSEPNGVIRRHPKISLVRYCPDVDCIPGEEY